MATTDLAPSLARRGRDGVERRLDFILRSALLALFAMLVAVKLPNILLLGRFWAEEGNKFFENAWMLPWPQALLAPWGGYLNITANLAGVLAWHLPPLVWAPYADTIFALVFQLCPALLVLTARDEWLRPLPALALLLTVPAADEVWLSSIGTQCHLNLCAGIILALATRSGWVGLLRLALLLLAALSGPGAWVLAPLFALRAALERSWGRLVQAATIWLGVILQLTFFYSHEAGRSYSFHPLLFLEIAFSKYFITPFFGFDFSYSISGRLSTTVASGHLSYWALCFMAVLIVVGGAALIVSRCTAPRWLAASGASLAVAAHVGSLGNPAFMLWVNNGGRYAFAPQGLFVLAMLALATTARGVLGSSSKVGTAWLIVIGATYFAVPVSPIFANGPSWRIELARHLADPSHVVAGWPPGWTVPLPATGRIADADRGARRR